MVENMAHYRNIQKKGGVYNILPFFHFKAHGGKAGFGKWGMFKFGAINFFGGIKNLGFICIIFYPPTT